MSVHNQHIGAYRTRRFFPIGGGNYRQYTYYAYPPRNGLVELVVIITTGSLSTTANERRGRRRTKSLPCFDEGNDRRVPLA